MKYSTHLAVSLIGISFLAGSCSVENQQPLINSIKGTWQVTDVEVAGGEISDYYSVPQSGTLTFGDCKASDSRNRTDACTGSFRTDADESVFSYTIHQEPTGQEILNLSALTRNRTGKFLSDPSPTWTFTRRSKREFLIERFSYGKNENVTLKLKAVR